MYVVHTYLTAPAATDSLRVGGGNAVAPMLIRLLAEAGIEEMEPPMLPTTGADNIRLAALDWITPVVLPRIFAVLELTTPSDCLRLTFIYALIRMNQKLLILLLHDNTACKVFL